MPIVGLFDLNKTLKFLKIKSRFLNLYTHSIMHSSGMYNLNI